MSNTVKLSLITVCYNAGKLIEDTLQSALNQSFKDYELVIIDGGSTDNTLEIIKRFQPQIGTLISEKDNGIYDAMNKGVKAAKGEYVYFLNAGDSFYHSDVLYQIFSNPLTKNADLIYGKVETKNEPTGVNYTTGKPVEFSMFYSHYPICHQATFAKKALFNQVGFFNTSYSLVADGDWFIRVFKLNQAKKIYADQIIAFYDIQGATYHKRMKGYREYIQVGFKHFPLSVALLNLFLYPIIWLKVWVIRTFQHMNWFKKYRQIKFKNNQANA
ncbi:MAG: glycosyltransferase family 2 protein [bacterium]|nr:glycosyltransferase family 2 protein [bacterium]